MKKNKSKHKMENYAIILDYLPSGYKKYKTKPIAQAIGTDYLTLLELAPKRGIDLKIGEMVFIGKGKRPKIYRVLGKIDSEKLTPVSKVEIDYALKKYVISNEQKFVKFFNESGGLTPTLHQLGLLPGINGTMVYDILKERENKKFNSFKDISNRVSSVKNPEKNIVKKLKEELKIVPSKKEKLCIYL